MLASSIATRGLCSELLEGVLHEHELLTCDAVLEELQQVLERKFVVPLPVIRGFLGLLKAECQIVIAPAAPNISFKDADDIPILACVISGKADVFVTGDKALLELGTVEKIPMLSPRRLWQKLSGL